MVELAGLLPFAEGFALGGGLIVAIGAQNAFVLRQGLRRQHVFVVCTLCFVADAALIAAGAVGVGTLVAANPWLTRAAAWGGAAFLGWYGVRSFRAALDPGRLEGSGEAAGDRRRAISATLAFTFLNPHVYLDTVVLVGGLAGQYAAGPRAVFAAGAIVASFAWFYGLGYGARLLAPAFRRPATWRVLDLVIGIVMWTIAGSLIAGELR